MKISDFGLSISDVGFIEINNPQSKIRNPK